MRLTWTAAVLGLAALTALGCGPTATVGSTSLQDLRHHKGDAGASSGDAGTDGGAPDAGATDAGTSPGGLVISAGLTLSSTTVVQGQTVTGSVTYTNTGSTSISLTTVVIGGRPPGGTNSAGPYDDFTPSSGPISISAGASYTLTAKRTILITDPVGQWYAFPTYQDAAGTWHDGPSVYFTVSAASAPDSGTGPGTDGGVSAGGAISAGWWAAWQTGAPISSIPWSDLKQIYNFSYVTATAAPFINSTTHGVSPTEENALVGAAHAQGKAVLITIGGSDDQYWSTACNATNRSTFISNMIARVQTYGYDGIDLDVEEGPFIGTSDFYACVQAFRAAVNGARTQAGNVPLLTLDSDPSWMAPLEAQLYPYLDQFNLMGYGATCASNCSQFTTQVTNYTSRGVPASKVIVGIGLDPGDPQELGASDCGAIASFSAQNAGGVVFWTVGDDYIDNNGTYPCLDAAAPYL